jgi:hypothetical protein
MSSFHEYNRSYLYINFEGPTVAGPTRATGTGDMDEEGAAGPLIGFA